MRKIIALLIAALMLILAGCGKDNASNYLDISQIEKLTKQQYELDIVYEEPALKLSSAYLTMDNVDLLIPFNDSFILSGNCSETSDDGEMISTAIVCLTDKAGNTVWQNEYGNNNLTVVSGIVSQNDNIYICGYSNSSAFSSDDNNAAFIICLNSNGEEQFRCIYEIDDLLCSFSDIALFDEYILAVGMSYNDNATYALICAYDYEGNLLWKSAQSSATAYCEAQKIAKNNNAPIILCHYYNSDKEQAEDSFKLTEQNDNIIMMNNHISQAKITLLLDSSGTILSGFPMMLPYKSNDEIVNQPIEAVDIDVIDDTIIAAGTVDFSDEENISSSAVTVAYDLEGRLLWSDNIFGNNGSASANLWIYNGSIYAFGRRYDDYCDIENYYGDGESETLPNGPLYLRQYSKAGDIVSTKLINGSEYNTDKQYYLTGYFPYGDNVIAVK